MTKRLFLCELLYWRSYSKHDKRIKVQLVLKSWTLHYAELLQFSLKDDVVNNGYFLFAEEVISKPQYAEKFIKSFQFNLVTTFSDLWLSQGKEGLCAKQKSRRISSWPALWKINTPLRSKFIYFLITPATERLSII